MTSSARVASATERLYALLPAHIRSVDAANGWALKAFVQVLASGSVEIDREIDALYDAMFVETAPEPVLEDLAALVASEPLHPLPAASGYNARAFIANTVRYRRGKGTARVLEALAADVRGPGAVAVEYFMRLARAQSLIDVRTERPGTAYLVSGMTHSRTATAFDVLPRLIDVRSISRAAGRHHVSNVGVHVVRPLVPVFAAPPGDIVNTDNMARVPLARPWLDGAAQHAGYFQLSAQPGRTLRLFNPDRRSQDDAGRVTETDQRDRLRRLPLHLETEELRKSWLEGRPPRLGETPWFDQAGHPFAIYFQSAGATEFRRVPPAQILICNLEKFPTPAGARPVATKGYDWFTAGTPSAILNHAAHPISCGFDPVTGRLIVASLAAGAPDVEAVRIAYGTGIGREIGAGPHDRNADDVPFDVTDRGALVHFVRIVDRTKPEVGAEGDRVRPVKTLDKALAEWATHGAGRRGLIILTRCDREGKKSGASDITAVIHPDSELHIVAAQWRVAEIKPGVSRNARRLGYVVRRDVRFTIDANLRVTAAKAPPPGGRAGWLVLDGVELTQGLSLDSRAVSRLHVRHSTIRTPGGTAISTTDALDGTEVMLDRSVVGQISLDFGSGPATGSLRIAGSIVSADGAAGGVAILAATLDGSFREVTVFGESRLRSLEATNVIFSARAVVTRRQTGCVRFSSIAPKSALPRHFRCQPELALAAAAEKKGSALTAAEEAAVALGAVPLFLDTSLDEPTVAMLHPLTREGIRLGGENDTEMGVFSAAAEQLRSMNLIRLFEDFVPFGLEAGLIDDTCSSTVAARRNKP